MGISFYPKNAEGFAKTFDCSNSTAFILLDLLQIEDPYYCGTIPAQELPARIQTARATLAGRAAEFSSKGRIETGTRGATIISSGASAERYIYCLDRLEDVLQDAQSRGEATITWA